MTQRPRILIGIDGSDDGIRATRYGIGRAMRRDEDLWLVNAADDGVVAAGWGVMYDPTVMEEAGRAAVTQAKDLAVARGIDPERIHTDVFVGHPVSVLSELSKKAEILIVGRRASSGLERMFVGSTSTSLVANAACPLVVISAASTPEPTGAKHRITVAVGGSGDKAMRWAAAEAQSRQACLDVVHVIPYQTANVATIIPASVAQEHEWEARVSSGLESLVGPVRADFSDVEISLRASRGILVDQLIKETSNVDLLVLGGKPRLAFGLGGSVRGVLAHAACPVALIVR